MLAIDDDDRRYVPCVSFGVTQQRYVYVIRSERDPRRHYAGRTSDLHRRLEEHNAGESPHTRKFLPWRCVAVIRFADEARAEAFERFLKSGSGADFVQRHFL